VFFFSAITNEEKGQAFIYGREINEPPSNKNSKILSNDDLIKKIEPLQINKEYEEEEEDQDQEFENDDNDYIVTDLIAENQSKKTTQIIENESTLDFTDTEFSTIHKINFYPDFNVLEENWQPKKPITNSISPKSSINKVN